MNFWSKVRCSFSNSNFEPVLIKLEKSKPCGAHPLAAWSEPRADRVQTMLTSSDNGRRRLARAHDTAAAASPPTFSAASATALCGYKGSAPLMSSLFSSSSIAHAPPLLLLWFKEGLVVSRREVLKKKILDESHTSRYTIHPRSTKMYYDLRQ
jgi:hypothetical protein